MVPDAQLAPRGRDVRCGRCKHEWFVAAPVLESEGDDWDPLAMAAETAAAKTDGIEEALPPSFAAEEAPPAELAEADPADIASSVAVESTSEAPSTPASEEAPSPAAKQVPSLKPWAISKLPFMIAAPTLALLALILIFVAHYNAWAHVPVLKSIYSAVGAKPTDGLAIDELSMQKEEHDGKTNYILAGSISNHSATDRTVPTVRVTLLDAKGKSMWSRKYPVKELLKGGDVYPFRITNVETTQGANVATIQVDLGNSIQLMLR